MKREHKWNKEDAIITFFYMKFGTKGLLVKNEKELAESVIGSSIESLNMMSMNYVHLMGLDNGLDHYSEDQEKVVEEYSNKSFDEFKNIVNSIIIKRDLSENKKEYTQSKKIREDKAAEKAKAKKAKQDLDDIFIMMGKDPKKMRKV
jgi:hypothetical protein